MKIKVLLVSLSDGYSCQHLPSQLKQAGFHVALCGVESVVLHRSRYLDQRFVIPHAVKKDYSEPFVWACCQWQPDLILPTDEESLKFLYWVVRQEPSPTAGGDLTWIQQRLRATLGVAASSLPHRPRADLYRKATHCHIPMPLQHQVGQLQEATRLAHGLGYPVVLKREWSYGGLGVRVCHNDGQLHTAWQELDQGRNPYYALLLQRYIQGRLMMHVVAAWQGEVVAGLSAWQEQTVGGKPTNPSRTIRFTHCPPLVEAARRLLAGSGFNGFAAFDFMVESETNGVYLIEANGRWIQAAGFGPRLGVDLCQALWNACHGQPCRPHPGQPFDQQAAFFPHEWIENPRSPLLHGGQCDIPWHEPELFAAIVQGSLQNARQPEQNA